MVIDFISKGLVCNLFTSWQFILLTDEEATDLLVDLDYTLTICTVCTGDKDRNSLWPISPALILQYYARDCEYAVLITDYETCKIEHRLLRSVEYLIFEISIILLMKDESRLAFI